jgi:hypothetical protein
MIDLRRKLIDFFEKLIDLRAYLIDFFGKLIDLDIDVSLLVSGGI